MMNKISQSFLLLLSGLWVNAVHAEPTVHSFAEVQAYARSSGKRLIETAPAQRKWMTENEIFDLSRIGHERGVCGGFMDVTEHPEAETLFFQPFDLIEGQRPTQQHVVRPLLGELQASNLWSNVEHLSSYYTRYYRSDTGVQAAHWIRDQFIALSGGRNDVSVELFEHRFQQPSVIAKIQGNGPKAHEMVIIGAHEDSIKSNIFGADPNGHAPGADDDASGVATVLETFRVLAQSGFRPERTLVFMTYAGEELGLLGSQDIAVSYQQKGAQVVGVMQLDMAMYPNSRREIVLIVDHTNPALTLFTKALLDEYVQAPYRDAACGYACSDHASWHRAGYPAVFPGEAAPRDHEFNRKIHTPGDTLANSLDAEFGLHFAKTALAFMVEMAAIGN